MIQSLKISITFAGLTLLVACAGQANADSGHACDAASPAIIAEHFGVAESSVTEQVSYESRDKKSTTDCQWQFVDSQGHTVLVNYRKRERTEKITNPNFFKANIAQMVANGHKVGSKTISFTNKDLAGVKGGAISELFGNRYNKELFYLWQVDEQRMKKVSLNRNVNDAGTLNEPTEAELAELVKLFK